MSTILLVSVLYSSAVFRIQNNISLVSRTYHNNILIQSITVKLPLCTIVAGPAVLMLLSEILVAPGESNRFLLDDPIVNPPVPFVTSPVIVNIPADSIEIFPSPAVMVPVISTVPFDTMVAGAAVDVGIVIVPFLKNSHMS